MTKAPRPIPGSLDLQTLERQIGGREIDTVIAAVPDLYGRLMGKRITGRFFLDEIAGGCMRTCDYLYASDIEMDPTPGYAFTSWAKGYGDMRAIPDFATDLKRQLTGLFSLLRTVGQAE